ncbi:hypothetical protein CRG98_010517 [Punica granatum]|uniref:Uncharacterized protein n=1 Tax=Punica granatum TaxID=22663 RepID=A0A2I0KKK6_PUNGR|nr:hypothetical protein CRG98_010517 [Punica granatum]
MPPVETSPRSTSKTCTRGDRGWYPIFLSDAQASLGSSGPYGPYRVGARNSPTANTDRSLNELVGLPTCTYRTNKRSSPGGRRGRASRSSNKLRRQPLTSNNLAKLQPGEGIERGSFAVAREIL